MRLNNRFFKILPYILSFALLGSCVPAPVVQSKFEETAIASDESRMYTQFESNETEKRDLLTAIEQKADEINGETLGVVHGKSETAIAVILHDSVVYDFWFFDTTEESLILTSTVYNGEFCKKIFNGENFLIVSETIIGHAYPANIVAMIDGQPKILSAIEYNDAEYSGLFYSKYGEIVCMRGDGISIGTHNVIPYYWNAEKNEFLPYKANEITIDEAKALDSQSVIENFNDIISIYRRDNGLVHVNYRGSDDLMPNVLRTVSATYVQTETGLRKYDFETDAAYGLFLEYLPVNE